MSRQALNFAAAILQRAKDRNGCYGRYCLVIDESPQIPKPTSEKGRQLIEAANLFIDLTGTTNSHAGEVLHSDENGSMMIEKQSRNCGSRVIVQFRPSA